MSSMFTAPETWKGGFFELFIQPCTSSSDELCSLLKLLWSFPSLHGCYAESNREPSSQTRVLPCGGSLNGHRYGLVTLPNGKTIACGSYASDYGGEEGVPPSHWVGFYLPLGALSTAYKLGAYPFGPMDSVSHWKIPIESFLAELGRWIFAKTPFAFALIGFEVRPDRVILEKMDEGNIPEERDDGILWNNAGVLNWYPSTRP